MYPKLYPIKTMTQGKNRTGPKYEMTVPTTLIIIVIPDRQSSCFLAHSPLSLDVSTAQVCSWAQRQSASKQIHRGTSTARNSKRELIRQSIGFAGYA